MRAFREESGNAGISGRELPSVEVLASMQHVEDRARALRDAGVPGTWEELKVRATLDLLQERDSRPAPGEPPASGGTEDAGGPGPGPAARTRSAAPVPAAPARRPGSGTGGPSIGALITITVPHTALDGDAGAGRAKWPGSGSWTTPTPGTWSPPPPATRPPGGA